MDEENVRERAQALCDALVAGDIDRVIAEFSEELHHNLGEVIGLLPLPATEAAIDSIEHVLSAFTVVIRIVGESDVVMVQTRWKDRDGRPTVVEVSHLSRVEAPPAIGDDSEGTATPETEPAVRAPA
jgi:hypothetical protein